MRLSKVLLCSVLSIGILAKIDAAAAIADDIGGGLISRVRDGVKELMSQEGQAGFIAQFGTCDAVTAGYGPRPVDIRIVNQSAGSLRFLGYNIRYGKVIAGKEAPEKIESNSIGEFAVSGREMAFYGPFGAVKYEVLTSDGKLGEIIFDWSYPWKLSDGEAGEAITVGELGSDVAVSAKPEMLTFTLTSRKNKEK